MTFLPFLIETKRKASAFLFYFDVEDKINKTLLHNPDGWP